MSNLQGADRGVERERGGVEIRPRVGSHGAADWLSRLPECACDGCGRRGIDYRVEIRPRGLGDSGRRSRVLFGGGLLNKSNNTVRLFDIEDQNVFTVDNSLDNRSYAAAAVI